MWWNPPEPVRWDLVLGNAPCESSKRVRDSSPPLSGSTSRASTPERPPVGTPMFASGQRFHHICIFRGSVVASICPRLVSGSLPLGLQGKTGFPFLATASAALRSVAGAELG